MRDLEQLERRRAKSRRQEDVPLRDMVPAQRDFLRAVSRRRRSIAFVATVLSESDVHRATNAAVPALATTDANLRLVAAARPPLLALEPCVTRAQAQVARIQGADAVLVPACLTLGELEAVLSGASSARMLPLLEVYDEAELATALQLRPRAVLVATPDLARLVRAPIVVVAPAGTQSAARALAGLVDAVLASHELVAGPSFQALVTELGH